MRWGIHRAMHDIIDRLWEPVTTRRFCRKFNGRFARQIFEEMLMNQMLADDLDGVLKRQFAGMRGVGCLPRTR